MDILNSIIEFFNKGIFSAFSNVSAIVGLVISIFVLIRVRRIERNYILRFRVPTLISKIEDHALHLSTYLSDYRNFITDTKGELARSKANLKSLQAKVNRPTRKLIKALLKQMQSYGESHQQLKQLSPLKSALYHMRVYRLGKAGQTELQSNAKRDAVYSIYENMLTLTEEVKNTQEDQRLD